MLGAEEVFCGAGEFVECAVTPVLLILGEREIWLSMR